MLWVMVSSLQTQIHTQPSEAHTHTHRAKVGCSGNAASFTDFFFEKGEAPPGKDLDGGTGGERKAYICGPPPRLQASGEGVGVGEVRKGGCANINHKDRRTRNATCPRKELWLWSHCKDPDVSGLRNNSCPICRWISTSVEKLSFPE